MKKLFLLSILISSSVFANSSITAEEHDALVIMSKLDLESRGFTVYTSSDENRTVVHPSELKVLSQVSHYFTLHGEQDYGFGPEEVTCTQRAIFTKGLNKKNEVSLEVDFIESPDCR